MKRTLALIGIIALTAIMGLSVIGCGGTASPTDVVKKLHTAIEKEDAEAIGELMTPESAQMMVMFLEKSKGMLELQGGIESTEETITDDTAVVMVTYKNGETDQFDLVKVDGKWKVILDVAK